MKRRLFKLVLFLVLGAIVNVAVAWGCAWLAHLKGYGGRAEFDLDTLLTTYKEQEVFWNPNRVTIEDAKGFGMASIFIDCSVRKEQGHLAVHKAGWPVYSLAGEAIYSSFGWEPRGVLLVNHPTKHWYRRPLPLRPIWTGFSINTIFYAAILWLLTLGPFTARRMIRHKRGHCIKCGYDLRGAEHEVCPECGVATIALSVQHGIGPAILNC